MNKGRMGMGKDFKGGRREKWRRKGGKEGGRERRREGKKEGGKEGGRDKGRREICHKGAIDNLCYHNQVSR